ncbi:toprim domain-containing protein [Desulfurobacterium atlanticum]|uniref:Toprim-like n=1 Tax=Desulfurobacterium atlanticum TaxID=240169 RepID=A0A238YR69_9BACT|nr:toprim domain-containing protein [Desulfurobacterium atlanticum]SNR73786.1 Toprim-like [Desulfurobacterium atlanticum]
MNRQQELHRIKSIPPEIILEDFKIPFTFRNSYIEATAVWRNEKTPSVSIQKNEFGEWLWHDFGTGKGGSWIDLVMVLYNCDYITAVRLLREKYLEKNDFPDLKPDFTPKSCRVSTVKIIEVKKVSSPALLKYLRERKITKIPNWLKEIHWEINGRKYFGAGIKTETGSYTVRNKFGKWNLKEKAEQKHSYSLIEKGSRYIAIFEGLFDALSWEQLKFKQTDILILNSVVNVEKALAVIEKYDTVILGLDNDKAGLSARRKFEKINSKTLYLKFESKDLNEALKKQDSISLLPLF